MSGDGLPRRAGPALVVALVAFLAQIPAALPGAFVWDDVPLLASNDLYTSPARWAESLSVPLGMETWYWRPLATTSFLVERLVHGGGPDGYRVTSALLHAVAAACVFLLLARLVRSRAAAALGALAWALHPANVEAVTWASARFDLLAGLLTFATLLATGGDGSAPTRRRRVLVGCAAAGALLAKEGAIALPLLVIAWAGALAPDPETPLATLRRARRAAVAAAVGLGCVVLVRLERLGFVFGAADTAAPEAGEPWRRLLLVGRAAAAYAEALFLPWSGVGPAHHGPRPVPTDDVRGIVGLVLLGAAITALVWLVRTRPRAGALLAAAGLSIGPVLEIVPLDLAGGLHAADRYLYVPSFFVVALATLALATVAKRAPLRRAVAGVGVATVLALGVGRTPYVRRWTSPERFWEWAVACAPKSSISLANLVCVLRDDGWPDLERLERAEKVARDLHQSDPRFASAYELVEVLLAQERTEEASALVMQARQMHARDARLLVLEGRVRLAQGRVAEAIADFERAVELLRGEGMRYASLLPTALGGLAEAREASPAARFAALGAAQEAERLLPGAPGSVVQVARAYLAMRRLEDFRRVIGDGSGVPGSRWKELIVMCTGSFGETEVTEHVVAMARAAGMADVAIEASQALGNALVRRWEPAVAHYRRITELAPELAIAWDDLGYALYETGDADGAESALRTAVKLDPEFGRAHLHLGTLLRRKGATEEGAQELERALELATKAGDKQLAALVQAAQGGGR